MRVDNHLIWRDVCVSVFADEDKCLVVFVNDKGHTKTLNYDDNFYSIEDSVNAYCDLLRDSLGSETDEYQEMINEFIYDQFVKDGSVLDFEYLKSIGIEYTRR